MIASPAIGKHDCEDVVDHFGSVFWLLDGASLPVAVDSHPDYTTGWFVRTLSFEISRAVLKSAGKSTSLAGLLFEAIAALVAHPVAALGGANCHPPSATVVLLRLNATTIEYLVLGDSYLLLEFDGELTCVTDLRLKEIATDIRLRRRTALTQGDRGATESLSRLLALEELKARNKEGGYWIAAQDPEAAHHAVVGTRQLINGGVHCLAMSDGYAAAYRTHALHRTWADLLAASTADGLVSIVRAIREVEGLPHLKLRSDDASALLVVESL